MNYLEFKRFFMQTNSDKAFILISSNWVNDSEFLVFADYGTANDFSSSFQINTLLSSIITTHATNDFVIAYANEDAITAFIDTCTLETLKATYVITPSINSKLDVYSANEIKVNLTDHSRINVDSDINNSNDLNTTQSAIIGYFVAELLAYEIVDLLIQYTHTINNFVSLDYGAAKNMLIAFIEQTSIGSILSANSTIEIEDIIFSFIQNYSTIVDIVESDDFTTVYQAISNLSSNMEMNPSSDFIPFYFNSTNIINALIKLFRETYLIEYVGDYLDDLSNSTLDSLILIEI